MAPIPKKGPNIIKTKSLIKDRTLLKPPESNKSLRDKALQDKVFYFDFKNTNTAAWLEKEIRKLGGRVEYFFGKEVHYLITDKPHTRQPAHIPPCSPFSNGPSPHFSRPDTSQSMRDVGPSPSDWAYSEQWKKPQASSQRSRGKGMLEMASVNKSQGSCDVLSRAKERGTIIKTVEQITSWLNTVHKKLGTKLSSEILKETPKNPSRKLRGEYMKIQDRSRKYKPQVLESSQWQTIDQTLLTDDSPFNTEKRRLTRKQANELHKPETGKKSITNILLKKEIKKKPEKREKGFIRRKGGGKCEGCNVRFDNLETHLSGEQHLKYAKKDKNFETVDVLVADGLSLDNFLKEHELRAMYSKKVASQSHVLSPQLHSRDDSTETLDVDGPCTRARKHKYFCQAPNEHVIPPNPAEQMLAPSPKVGAGVPELENNYYLRSTPRKLVGMLEIWDTHETIVLPEQGPITTQPDTQLTELPNEKAPPPPPITCWTNSAPPLNSPSKTPLNSPGGPRSRNNSAKLGSPANSRVNSPAKSRVHSPAKSRVHSPANTRSNSPAKRSPRLYKDNPAVKRRITNHS